MNSFKFPSRPFSSSRFLIPSNRQFGLRYQHDRELNVKGSFRYGAGVYPLAIDLVARGLIKLKPLITHRYKFKEAVDAFKTTQNGKGEDGRPAIKTIIDGPIDE
jgi:threonine dehydrogenase-like Zn-dependent dehydrogenase